MISKLKSSLRIVCHSFGRAVCAGAVLLISTNAQSQNLFEADYGSGQIYEFTPGGAQSTFASGLNQPLGLAFDNVGNLFEADANSGNIYEFTSGGAQSLFASGLGRPNALAFVNAGNLFVADGISGDVYEFTPGGAQSTFAPGLTGAGGNCSGRIGNGAQMKAIDTGAAPWQFGAIKREIAGGGFQGGSGAISRSPSKVVEQPRYTSLWACGRLDK